MREAVVCARNIGFVLQIASRCNFARRTAGATCDRFFSSLLRKEAAVYPAEVALGEFS